MRQVSPQSYQGLFFVDYPTKNEADVNALARKNVTTDQVKDQIAHQVNTDLEPMIESKMANMNPVTRCLALKTIEKTINVAVYQAVDTVVLDDNNTPTTAKTKP